jgi:hypothetical protein
MTLRRSRGALVLVTALLVGCTGAGSDDGPATADEDGSVAAPEPEEEVRPSGRLLLTGFAEHQLAGLSMALRGVEVVDGEHLLVEIEAVNSGTSTKRLNGLTTFLEDDRGNRYPFRPPAEDGSLTLRNDQRLTGTLSFEGPLDPEARRFVLAFNQSFDTEADEAVGAQDRPSTDHYPPMAFRDVPLPGVGLEAEATLEEPGSLLDDTTVEVGVTASPEAAPDVEVTVVGYTTDGRTIEIDLEVVNGSSETVRMLAHRPHLTDDLGSRFHFRRGEGDDAEQRLELRPGEEASATLGFRATLRPAAGELRLTLNSFSLRDGNERAPGLVFTLPMPDGGGEAAP